MPKRSISTAADELCLVFPDSESSRSHGLRDYRVKGKIFAQYVVNHHGDGRVALWLNVADGVQQECIVLDDESYFVPPYVGARGWLGMNLDKELSWDEIQYQVTEAYLHTAGSDQPVEDFMPDVPPPNAPVDPVEFDAFNQPGTRALLEDVRKRCLALPEVTEGTQFGTPAFKASKKTFLTCYVRGSVCVEIWVGKNQQPALVEDSRFIVPRYTGPNGWIQFKLTGDDWSERLDELLLESYKHFALKRMLKALA